MSSYITKESGRGVPIVMMHGMMGQADNWQGLFPYLPENCRAISLAFPFFQATPRLDSVQAVAAYARGYLDEQGLDRVVLCGNSLGGHAALVLALEMPQRVLGLVLSGSSGLFERGFKATQGSRPSRQWIKERVCEIFYDPALVTEALLDQVCNAIWQRSNARDIVHIAKSAKRDNLADRLGKITCPSLLVWGRQDNITPPDVAEEFHERLANSELHWLEKCCHAAMMEHPRAFAELLSSWWNRCILPRVDASAGRMPV